MDGWMNNNDMFDDCIISAYNPPPPKKIPKWRNLSSRSPVSLSDPKTKQNKKADRDPSVVRSRSALVQTTDDFERIIKVWPKCCSGIFYMQRKRLGAELSGAGAGGAGSGQRY